MRGQGSTEYIVILAVVLVLVLIALSALGVFSGFAEDARIGESQAYWSDGAQPFAVIDWKLISQNPSLHEALYLRVQNKAGTRLNLTSFNLNYMGTSISPYSTSKLNKFYLPGESFELTYDMAEQCSSNHIYEFDVSANYSTSSIANLAQKGAKPLIIRCT